MSHHPDDHIEYVEPLSPDLADEFEDGLTKEELAANGLPPLPKVTPALDFVQDL